MSEEQIAQAADFAPPAPPMEGGDSGEGSGQGQARGFRRRRRRRPAANANGAGSVDAVAASSGSAGEDSGPAQAQPSGEAQAAPQQRPQEQGRPQNSGGQQNIGGQQNQGGQNGQTFGRRKNRRKKFFQERQGGGGGAQQQAPVGNRADRPSSNGFQNGGGYQNNGNGGGGNFQNRRKQKGRSGGGGGARGFVGPMDHMYREGNGNYAENSPSTISVNGNQNGGHRRNNNAHMHDSGHQAQFLGRFFEPPAPVIAEDAPTHVFCLIDDLFFTAKITEAARKLGVKVAFLKAEKEDLAKLSDSADGHTVLLMVDLNNANAKPLTIIQKLHTKLKRGISIVGFLSNLQGDLKAKAVEAGCDSVMPRSAFSQSLPNLLKRYGLTEEQNDAADAQHTYF